MATPDSQRLAPSTAIPIHIHGVSDMSSSSSSPPAGDRLGDQPARPAGPDGISPSRFPAAPRLRHRSIMPPHVRAETTRAPFSCAMKTDETENALVKGNCREAFKEMRIDRLCPNVGKGTVERS